MRKRSFTFVEIIIVIVILGILVTVSFPLYQNIVENAKAKVCETNQEVILKAIKTYALENDRVPGSLSQLRPEHLREAWAKVFKEKNPWIIKLCYFIVDFEKRGFLYAQDSFYRRYLGGDIKLITCPKDDTPPPDGTSYGINEEVAGMSYSEYKKLPEDEIIVADCDYHTFSTEADLDPRHFHWGITGKEKIAIGINKGRKKLKFKGSEGPGEYNDDDETNNDD